MTEQHFKAFLEKVQADTTLQEKLKAAKDAEAVTTIAKEEGFNITIDDINNAQVELSEEDLEHASGGKIDWGRGTHTITTTGELMTSLFGC